MGTRTSRRIVLLTGAGVTALALGLAGCSSSTPAGDTPPSPAESPATQPTVAASPAAFIAQAADATKSAGSAKIVTTSTVSTQNQQIGDINVKGEGIVDFAGQQMDLKITASILGTEQKMEVVVVGGKSYIRMAMLGDKWIEAPVSDLGVNVADPSEGLQQLKEVADLKEAGTEEINGAPATKYTGSVDIAKALADAGVTEEQLQQMGDLSKLDKDAVVTVWVDDEGRIVRFDQALAAEVAEVGRMTIKTSTTLSDFGVATNITPPPASEVTQMPNMPSQGTTG